MALIYISSASSGTSGSNTRSFVFDCGAGANLLLAFAGYADSPAQAISTCTYAGSAMTQISTSDLWASWPGILPICYKINPAAGSNTFSLTTTFSISSLWASVISFSGAHATTPIGALNEAQAHFSTNNGTPLVTLASSAGRIVTAAVTMNDYPSATASITSGTSRIIAGPFNSIGYALATTDGGGTISWTYTGGSGKGWAVSAVEILPEPEPAPVTIKPQFGNSSYQSLSNIASNTAIGPEGLPQFGDSSYRFWYKIAGNIGNKLPQFGDSLYTLMHKTARNPQFGESSYILLCRIATDTAKLPGGLPQYGDSWNTLLGKIASNTMK